MSNISLEALKCLSADAQTAVKRIAREGYCGVEFLVGYAWEFSNAGLMGEKLEKKIRSALRNDGRAFGNRSGGRVRQIEDYDESVLGGGDNPADTVADADVALKYLKDDEQSTHELIVRARYNGFDRKELAQKHNITVRREQQIWKKALDLAGVQLDLFHKIEAEEMLAELAE